MPWISKGFLLSVKAMDHGTGGKSDDQDEATEDETTFINTF